MTQTLYYGEVHGEGYAKIIVWLKIQFLQQQAHVKVYFFNYWAAEFLPI